MEEYYDLLLSEIPDRIDFGFITVKNEASRTIYLNNTSEISIIYKIENEPTYIFEPHEGIIPKNSKIEIKLKYKPKEASVLISNAKFTLDNKKSKIIKISSISKYPYLRLNKQLLDFGVVQIGKSVQLELIITNAENVSAKFNIKKQTTQPGKHPEIFYVSALNGEIPANSNFLLKIVYKPFFAGYSSFDTFVLKTIGGNEVTFTCQGLCQEVSTWLSSKYVNFKSIPLGNKTTKMIRIFNGSDTPTEYQMFYDNSNVFDIKETQGVIPAKSNVRINVSFTPYETSLYYERVFCLVKNHFILTLDLYGSCHDLLVQTAMLNQKLIDAFRFKLFKGLYSQKNSMLKEKEIIDKLSRTKSVYSKAEDNLTYFTTQIQLHKEMFWENTSVNRLINFETDHIDFNYVENGKISEPYILRVTNNSNEKMKLKWIYDKPINVSNLIKNINIFNVESTVFFAQPEETVLDPKKATEFKVYFKPNKNEYYFYTDLPLTATIVHTKKKELKFINKNKLSETGRDLLTKSIDINNNKSKYSYKSNLFMSVSMNRKKELMASNKVNEVNDLEDIDPPFTNKISIVGHTFGPGSQIFIPIYDITPKREIFFPPSSINQSYYQTLKIHNKSDTPLYYKLSADPLGVFRAYRKYGLIPANQFHLICLEFCPKDTCVYRFPLRIVFNHDNRNMKTILLNGLCTDPIIKVEGISQNIYFPPSYTGIRNKRTIEIKNFSPIKIHVNIQIIQTQNCTVEINPNSFDMEINMNRKIDIYMSPNKNEQIFSKIKFSAERLYDPNTEALGIFTSESQSKNMPVLSNNSKSREKSNATLESMSQMDSNVNNTENKNQTFDRRLFIKEVNLIGQGSDGELKVEPEVLSFGTVKVGFRKKLYFSIYNPTITNFKINVVPEIAEECKQFLNMIDLDFKCGLINSFCKKEVQITFKPTTRIDLNFKLNIRAISDSKDLEVNDTKCSIAINAKGDYPLIKIVDIRNNFISSSVLWKNFNVDKANEELQQKLTDEEINYMLNSKDINKKGMDNKLKVFKFDFGKHEFKRNIRHNFVDIYLTFKNEGGVRSEFYFKFPEDIAITREIWMDPVEESNKDLLDYQVLKGKIFEVFPKEQKLDPNESCNIKLRYNIKEMGEQKLRLIFQIVNGKPVIFELCGNTIAEKTGVLEIYKDVIDFGNIPIGYMNYIATPIELCNEGPVKLRYYINTDDLDEFNKQNDNIEIFKIENKGDIINEKEKKYFVVYFRPLTTKEYKLKLNIEYSDEVSAVKSKFIIIKGNGFYSPNQNFIYTLSESLNLPKSMVCCQYENNLIRYCGLSLEVLNFGVLGYESKCETFIIYNFSLKNSFNFDFIDPGFLVKDEISIQPSRGTIEPNSHLLVKIVLTSKEQPSNYEGDLQINVVWNNESCVNTSGKTIEKENMYIRIIKKSMLLDSPGSIESTYNPNSSFVETILSDLTKEILSDNNYSNYLCENLDKQPLSLYNWANDHTVITEGDTRNKYIENTIKKLKLDTYKKNKERPKLIYRRDPSTCDKRDNSISNDDIGENMELELDEKYIKELMNKYKYTLNEINEKLILVNEGTKSLISDTIMENTIYNIVSEAVYGETDLTEKPRIYFFYKK